MPKNTTEAPKDLVPKAEVQSSPAERLATLKQEIAAGAAAKEKESADAFLKPFPEGQNLVGGASVDFTLDNKPHTIQFTDKGLVLDGVAYKFVAVGASPFGGDVNLSLYEVSRSGQAVLFRAGAYYKEGKVEGGADKVRGILESLLTAGVSEQKTKEGKTIRITK